MECDISTSLTIEPKRFAFHFVVNDWVSGVNILTIGLVALFAPELPPKKRQRPFWKQCLWMSENKLLDHIIHCASSSLQSKPDKVLTKVLYGAHKASCEA